MKVTRRDLLRLGTVMAGGVLAGCAPKVVEVTREVEKEVEKVVKETVVVDPSGEKRGFDSTPGCDVRRTASPPLRGTVHRSPA